MGILLTFQIEHVKKFIIISYH